MKRSKAYRAAAESIDADQLYSPEAALDLVKKGASAKFDETVEVAMRLGVDPRKADQMVRGTVNLPNGTGKTARVLVFATGEKAAEALAAGADEVGDDELIDKVSKGYLDFDSVVATPDLMGKVGRLGRVLGPRGLMPNPKTGTVTMDVAKAVGASSTITPSELESTGWMLVGFHLAGMAIIAVLLLVFASPCTPASTAVIS